jgi:steroid delta-isomerase-like uncharacterized protein
MAEVSEIHREIYDAWNRRDWQTYRSLLHQDYRYIGPDGEEITGPDGGLELAKAYASAFTDGTIDVTYVHSSRDHAVCEFIARGTHDGNLKGIAPSGRQVEIRICNVMELRNGKVYREREYFDVMSLMIQIGAIRSPATAATSR